MAASKNDGCGPMMPCATSAPSIAPMITLPSNRLFRSPINSSRTNVTPARGVLKAAANPAAAPVAVARRRFCLASPTTPARSELAAPAICTLGPSRPKLLPPPICKVAAINLTHSKRKGTKPKSFQNATFNWGIPLPAAAGYNELSSQPETRQVPKTNPRLLHRNVACEQCERRTKPARKTLFIATWKNTAISPATRPYAQVLSIVRGRSGSFDSHSTSIFTR